MKAKTTGAKGKTAASHPPGNGKSRAAVGRDEAIRTRAYYLWEAAGREPGRELDFWLQAEQEIDRGVAG